MSKLSKQQHFLLRELERTKRRLQEEIWAREARTAIAPPINPESAIWLNKPFDNGEVLENVLPSTAGNVPDTHLPTTNVPGGRPGIRGTCLKRSRSEAGMSSVEGDLDGIYREKAMQPGMLRPSPTTRIDMLPVMSSTGE